MANNERGRIVLIFAAVAVALGAGGYYFIKVYRPKAALAAARADVTAWDARYQAARACLLGASPASSITSEALAVREMSPDPWDRGACTPLVGKLARDAANSGIDDVEHAWDAVDQAAGAAAKAFATHVGSSTTLTKDPLPAALDALDDARAALFTSVEIPLPATAGAPLTVVKLAPIRDGDEPVIELDTDTPPSEHGVVWRGKTATRLVQVTLPAAHKPMVMRLGPNTVRAVPDGSWGATAAGTSVRIGALDDEGAMGTAGEPAPIEIPRPEHARVIAVAGTRDHGIVALSNDRQLVFVDVTASAATVQPPIAIESAAATTDADGSFGVWWIGKDRRYAAKLWRAGQLQNADIAGYVYPAHTTTPCVTRDRVGVAAAGVTLRLLGCSATSALVQTEDGHELHVYGGTDRAAALPASTPDDATVTLLGDKLVAYLIYNGVVAAWAEDGKRTYFALPRAVRLVHPPGAAAMAPNDGKIVDLLAHDDSGFVLVRVPAT